MNRLKRTPGRTEIRSRVILEELKSSPCEQCSDCTIFDYVQLLSTRSVMHIHGEPSKERQ